MYFDIFNNIFSLPIKGLVGDVQADHNEQAMLSWGPGGPTMLLDGPQGNCIHILGPC